MYLTNCYHLTASIGKHWIVYSENGKFYKEFTAKNFQEAKAIAVEKIKEYESRDIQRPSPKL